MKILRVILLLIFWVVPSFAATNGRWESAGSDNFGQVGESIATGLTYEVHEGKLFVGVSQWDGSDLDAILLYTTDGTTWTNVAGNFNSAASLTRRLYSASDGYLYLGTSANTPKVYRSNGGLTGWALVATLDATDNYVRGFVEFAGYTYFSTVTDDGTACRVYRSSDGVTWAQAWQAPNVGIDRCLSLMVYGDAIYLSTNDAQDQGGSF